MTRADPTTQAIGRRRAVALRTTAVAFLAVALSGCYTTRDKAAEAVPNDYRLRHPIVIQEGDKTVELFIGRNRGGLTPTQRADVIAFAKTWKREAAGGFVIEAPVGVPNERAAADTVPEVRSILATVSGAPPHAVAVAAYRPDAPVKLATIRIKYPRMVAEAGPCGLWPDDLGPSYANPGYLMNKPFWNLGCANQRNLAAMVDNPADLVQPRGETSAFTARRTVVLDKYTKGESPSTVYPNEDKNKISDVAK